MPDPTPSPEQSEQQEAPKSPAVAPQALAPAEGRRQAFLDIKRQLTPTELANTGTQKLILEMLLTTEGQCDDLKEYVQKFHEVDKKVGVLEEKLKTNKVNEIMFGVGVGIGCAIIGLAPFFWDLKPAYGAIALAIGILTTIGATVGRIVFK
jgi:hypothetical protein